MSGYRAKWPFQFVVDSKHESIRWAVVNARIVSNSRQEQFAQLRRHGFRFLGMSSDGTFPFGKHEEFFDYDAVCEAWCYCFREPEQYLSVGQPRTMISISDFTDYRQVSPEVLSGADTGDMPYFDFIYVGATEVWKSAAKNWPMARTCIPRICRELGLHGLLIGTSADDLAASSSLTFLPQLPWRTFMQYLVRARFLFLPNELDASPRVLTEALCLDVPVVVNRKILGGWKYVNAFTGNFFEDEEDVVAAVQACLAARRHPRNWFRTNYGPYLAGRRLLEFLKTIDPSIRERSHLCLTNRIDALPACEA